MDGDKFERVYTDIMGILDWLFVELLAFNSTVWLEREIFHTDDSWNILGTAV